MLRRYLEHRYIAGNSSVSRLSPALDLSFMLTKFKNYSTDEYSTMVNNEISVPPLACAFAKRPQHQHIVSVVDEDGCLVLYDTNKTGQAAVIRTWQPHANAVFDLEWMMEENQILTGSGDQTISLFDVETSEKLETFKGHASSIKSLSCRNGDDAVFASGARDGHIMVWDKRIYHKGDTVPPIDTIFNAHIMQQPNVKTGKLGKKKCQRSLVKDAQQSVTVVLFQNENYLISAGAVDGCLKVWDMRKTYSRKTYGSMPVYTFHYSGSNTRKHGYSSLVLDSSARRLFANCTDDVIYEYDMAAFNPKPTRTWRGHKNSTFYVRSAISSDNQYLLSGSSDEQAYIWQISNPDAAPIALKSHTAEVTAVAWCPNDITKVVTLSDDTKTKFWRIYCRELKRQFLPRWLGHAKRISKKTEVSEVACARSPSSSADSLSERTAPQRSSLQKSTSSPQSCIRDWLKRKVQSVDASKDQGPSPPKAVCKDNCATGSGSLTSKATMLRERKTADDSEILFDSSSKSEVSSPGSSSNSRKRSLDDTEDTVTLDSSVIQREPCLQCYVSQEIKSVDHSPTKRPKIEQTEMVLEEIVHARLGSSGAEVNRSIENCHIASHSTADLRNSAKIAQTSPSKLKRSIKSEENVENIPYQSPRKLRKLDSLESPAKSPKRPCLTTLESNSPNTDVSCIKMSLFADIVQDLDSSAGSHDNQKEVHPYLPSSCASEKHMNLNSNSKCDSLNKHWHQSTPDASSGTNMLNCGPSNCVEKSVPLCKSDYQNTGSDSDSPTRNLPSLVMDEVYRAPATVPKSVRKQKHNWLTQIRLEKMKSSESAPKQTNQGKLSPKVTKVMRKINSYFK